MLLKCLRVLFSVVADMVSPVCSYFLTVYNYIIREGRRKVNQKNVFFYKKDKIIPAVEIDIIAMNTDILKLTIAELPFVNRILSLFLRSSIVSQSLYLLLRGMSLRMLSIVSL